MEDTATKPLEPRWKKSKWQNTEEKRKKKARPPNPTPTEGVGFREVFLFARKAR